MVHSPTIFKAVTQLLQLPLGLRNLATMERARDEASHTSAMLPSQAGAMHDS
jgi:hypothetical protein